MDKPLSVETIIERLARAYHPGSIASMDGTPEQYQGVELRAAAVLVPLLLDEGRWQLLFTRRTQEVETHKGQTSFPGGGCDPSDASPEATALREAWEEIGLQPEHVRLLGLLNEVISISRYRITPVVGLLPWPYPLVPAPAEVARVFTLPLEWLAERENWSEQPFTPAGQRRPVRVITYRPYDGEVLWGITARLTHHFLAVLGLL
jgi:8-oxo-dGTP pyrophosphatase MutT (NUDIX family)